MKITTILFSLLIISVIFGASVYALEYKTLKLPPTDDAYIVVNPDDPDDLEKFQTVNTGDKEFLDIWSSHSISPEFGELNAIIYLKFDLRDVDVQNIAFSELWIFPTIINIENLEEIELFYVQDNDWNESEITYLTRPLIDLEPIFTLEIKPIQTWHIFDTMEIVEKNMGSEITLALNFKEKQSDQERSIEYSSNEGIDISLRPYLVIISDPSVGPTEEDRIAELESKILELQQQDTLAKEKSSAISSTTSKESKTESVEQTPEVTQESETLNLVPTDDAFVSANLNDPDDAEHLREQNTGDLPFLKTWYAWNVTENQEQIITIFYLKFDLGDIESDKVISTNLKLTPLIAKTVLGVAPELELGLVLDNDWNESEITYLNKPEHSVSDFIPSVLIDNTWYSWDVTDLVKENAGSSLSVVFSFKNLYDNTEELITFHSKEAEDPENFPVLEIEYATAIPPIPSSLQENETDYTLATIVGVLVAAAGIGIFFALILRKKSSKQQTAKQVTTTPSEKPRTDSQKQKPSQERKCKLCGKTLAQDFKVCPYCGYRV